MSIRPIDMQVMVHKSADIHKLNNNESGKHEVTQQQFSQQLEKQTKNSDQQIMQSNKSEHSVDKDGRGNAGGGSKNKKESKEKNKEESKSKSSSMFDVSI